MKAKRQPFYKRLLNSYRSWRSNRNQKVLDKLDAYSMDEAIRLANRKRDIANHTCWVVSGKGEHLVFLRYQKKSLQTQGMLKSHLTSKDLNEMCSYVALPYTSKDHKRGGILRRFVGNKK